VTFGAFVFDILLRFGVIYRFAPHACLPIRIPSGIGHHRRAPGESDGDVFTPCRRETVVARDAPVGGLKKVDFVGDLIRSRGGVIGLGHYQKKGENNDEVANYSKE